MDYNSFLSKNYKFEKAYNRKKKYNYKAIFLGIVTLTALLLFSSVNFSNQSSVAQANSDQYNSGNELQVISERIDLPELDTAIQIAKVDTNRFKPKNDYTVPDNSDSKVNLHRTIVTVKKNDSMAAIFKRNRFSAKTLHHMVYKTRLGKQLTRLKSGQKITFLYDQKRDIRVLRLHKSKNEALIIERDINNPKLKFSSSILKINSAQKLEQRVVKISEDLPQLNRSIVTVKKKDSMSAIFKRHRFSAKTLHHMVYKTKLGKQLTRLKSGQKVTFLYDQKRNIHLLRLQRNQKEALVLERNKGSKLQFNSKIVKIAADQRLDRALVKNSNKETSTSIPIKEDDSNLYQKPLPPLKNIVRTSSDTVKKGDTLASIFKRNNLNKSTLHYLVHSSKLGKQLTRIRPGQDLTFGYDKDNNLISLQLHKNRIETLILQRDYSSQSKTPKYVSYLNKKEVEIRSRFNSGTIEGSFFYAAKNAGMTDAMTMKLAHLFGWDIDFALNIRSGDSFSVLYEEKYLEGEKIANGDIIVAEFINQGKVFQAIRYTDASGHSDYYTPDGYSMRKAFLRTPVAFARISSRFSLGRKHPILNRIRAHKGVDYAAPRGTPIKATGSGKVIYKGRKGGYGKVVEIRHANKYRTLYAHLSSYNRKIKHGSRVKQGQIIGYVGSTGLATGPHLHYEFRVNGVHRNPLTVKLPNADPISKKYKNDFLKESSTLLSKLTLEKKQQLASAQ